MKASLISKIILGLCIVSLIAGFLLTDKDKPYNEGGKYNKTANKITAPVNKIAFLNLEGPIAASYESNFFSKEANASNLLKALQYASEDNDIKGVIIRINSPGGTVAMSQNIYNQILKIRKSKPVIALLDDVCASGGYYIASAADRIIAQEGTLTGSIGVIFSFMDFHELLQNKLLINPVVIKSGKYKDIGSSTRKMSEEERKLMQDIVNDSYGQFIDAITRGRINRNDKYNAQKVELTPSVLNLNADGRVFTGKKAVELGFADMTGDIDTAKNVIESMSQDKFKNSLKIKLIDYGKKSSFSEYFSSFAEYNSKTNFKLTDMVPTSMILIRKPLYLWE